jgi:hypothetical protein
MRAKCSIARLMLVVAAVAGFFAAWSDASEAAATVVLNLTVVLLLAASYKARYSRRHAAAFWLGFAVTGWVNLAAGFWQSEINLATVVAVDRLLRWVGPNSLAYGTTRPGADVSRGVMLWCLLSLAAAAAGGWAFRSARSRGWR